MLLLLLLLLCVRWAAAFPEASECFTVNGRDYRGSASRAGPEGTPCLYWNQTLLHRYNSHADPSGELGLGEHNHCRNPDQDVQPWCYVSETEDSVYWKYCDIPACRMPGYIGCFLDSGSPPALSGASGTSAQLSIHSCLQFCRTRGAQYAGVEAGYACFCGGQAEVAVLRAVGSSQCDQACFGRSSELCGGDGRLSVYAAWVGACRGNLSSSSGVLYSPDYPDDYAPGRECSWEVRPAGSLAVELTIRSFHVEDPNDVLEVRDGESGGLLAVLRGGRPPPATLTFPTPHVTLTFRSDQEGGGAGYVLTYTGLGKALSPDTRSPSPPAHPPTPYTEPQRSLPPSCWSAWLLAAALTLLSLAILLVLWRWAPCSWRALELGADAESSCCPALCRGRKGQRGDLTSVSQSSMKSLL